MNSWVWLALLSPGLLAFVNYIDKYMVESRVKDFRGIPVFSGFVGFFVGTLFWLVNGLQVLPMRDGLIVVATGFITLLGYYFYFHAIVKSATSYVIALLQMTPLLTLFLSVLLLQETLTMQQFVGFLVVSSAVIGLSLKKEKKGFHINSSFWYILCADILFALANILIKFALSANSLVLIFPYESWGLGLGGACLFLCSTRARTAFIETFRTVGKSVIGIMFFNETIFIISKAASFLAIALGPVALVSVLSGTQVFYGILYGWILMLIAPKVFREDVSKKGLFKKIILTTILFTGIWLIV
jgi:drug/metabolite transporter (DMT)-like permease